MRIELARHSRNPIVLVVVLVLVIETEKSRTSLRADASAASEDEQENEDEKLAYQLAERDLTVAVGFIPRRYPIPRRCIAERRLKSRPVAFQPSLRDGGCSARFTVA
jgi:hypothetical protein